MARPVATMQAFVPHGGAPVPMLVALVAFSATVAGACSTPRATLQADASTGPGSMGGQGAATDGGVPGGDGGASGSAPPRPSLVDGGVSPSSDAPPLPAADADPRRIDLTITVLGSGKGLVRPMPGVTTCQSRCVFEYSLGQTVTLAAEIAPPGTFFGFSGDCTGTAAACTVTLDRPLAVTARFEQPVGPAWKVPLVHGNVLGLAERDGKVYAAGSAQDEFDGSVVAADRRDVYVARFDLATGNRDWIRRVRSLVPRTNTGFQTVGLDVMGAVVLTGEMVHAADFGGALLQPPPELRYMARYAPDTGALLGVRLGRGGDWTASSASALFIGDDSHYWQVRSLDDVTTGPPADVTPNDMRAGALTPAGELILAGSFTTELRFGTTVLRDPSGLPAAFVGKVGVNARPQWATTFMSTGTARAQAVASDAGGDVLVTGTFEGSINIGGRTLTSAGEADAFVAKLAGADGKVLWALKFGGAKYDDGRGIGVLPFGRIFAAISTGGGVTLEGTTVYDGPGFVAFLAGPDGGIHWTRPLEDTPRSFLVTSNGHLLVGGWDSLVKHIP